MSGYYLKWTRKGRVPSYQGGTPIPYRKWTPRAANPVICERGWHGCRWEDAVHHISDELWVCELDGRIVAGDNKVAGERLRIVSKVQSINDRTLRLFAADCAEAVLPIFEREYPGDDRPRQAIAAARAYANGDMDAAALNAARDAARAAIWDAGAAAWDAAWAAGAAARAARDAAAWAAGDAAGAAAWDAARDAGAAARAAREAAGAAAWDAARAAQTHNLLVKYGGLDPANFTRRTS